MEKDVRELASDVKGLNVLIVSLLIGFEALRDLGKASLAKASTAPITSHDPQLGEK